MMPTARLQAAASRPDLFWRHVDRTDPSGCWSWTAGKTSSGYGQFTAGSRAAGYIKAVAHRVSYTMLVGPIPDGSVIDHLCRNTLCVNPAHLEPVTNRENVMRGDVPLRGSCRRGHQMATGQYRVRANGCHVCLECERIRRSTPEAAAKSVERTRRSRERSRLSRRGECAE